MERPLRLDRRAFVKLGVTALASLRAGGALWADPPGEFTPSFTTDNARWQEAYDQALRVLAGNVRLLPQYDKPVLIEGSVYSGIWLECGPLESLVYRKFRPDIARNSHRAFFSLQRPDGQLPASIKTSETGYGQIQMVVPIAATAWELARATGDEQLLASAYDSCSRWDDWLMRYRSTRGTGLIEGFCAYDTGHDNSPRWAGIPNRCPDRDARKMPAIASLPRLCPDLSATAYGGRLALSSMASALGKASEAIQWAEKAAHLRQVILSTLYNQADAAFYDLDAQGRFMSVRGDVLTRVCGEHIPDRRLFDELWSRQIHAAKAFWPAYPLPSVALDDPLFVRPIPRNSWGGASQALTALRAGRWLDHYGRSADFGGMMSHWCEAIQRDGGFRQQLDPLTGVFTQADAPTYSPCALVMVDYTWRLAGVREEAGGLHWNVRPGHPAAKAALFRLRTDNGQAAVLRYQPEGALLSLGNVEVARIPSGSVRLVTDERGSPLRLVGIDERPQTVAIAFAGHKPRSLRVEPNQVIEIPPLADAG